MCCMSQKEIESNLLKHWQPQREYTISEMISVFSSYRKAPNRNTIFNWFNLGLKVENENVTLKMSKAGGMWVVKGQDLIDFLIKTNR